jgi:hypothetical protein
LLIILIANVIFGAVPVHSYTGMFPGEEGGIQMLAGLVPSNQTKVSLSRTPWLAKVTRKIQQKDSRQIHFNGKRHFTTFDQTNVAFSWFDKVGFCQGI